MAHLINFNGRIVLDDTPIVSADNRGLRYGDGLFETMKMVNGDIALKDLHFDRLFYGMRLMGFEPGLYISAEYLYQQIQALCKRNEVSELARIRLNVFRKSGGLYDPIDHLPNFIIETSALSSHYTKPNEHGLTVGLFLEGRKSQDLFSSLKSNNYLPYLMGALYAKQNHFDDCLILNSKNRVCDATMANIFWTKNGILYTPPTNEGGIAGVMRRWILENLPGKGFKILEQAVTPDELLDADEMFLTNAVVGLRWVRSFQQKKFTSQLTSTLYPLLP